MNAFVIFGIVAVAAVSIAALVMATRGHGRQIKGRQDFDARWQQVDMEAFSNLSDPLEERYLRQNLPAAEFRRLQRQRVIVMWEYLSRLAENTKLMVQAGQIVQHASSGDAAVKARQFVSSAMQTRMLIFMAEASLAVKFVLPGTTDPVQSLVRKYENLSQSFAQTWTAHKMASATSAAS
jgi:hypothetical protein